MKKLLFTGTAILFISVAAIAQEQAQKSVATESKTGSNTVIWKEGKAYSTQNGVSTVMSADRTLGNGTVIMMDGTVKMKNGKSVRLTEGQSVDSNGQIVTPGRAPMEAPAPPSDSRPVTDPTAPAMAPGVMTPVDPAKPSPTLAPPPSPAAPIQAAP